MTVKKVFCDDHLINVTGTGYIPDGDFLFEGKQFYSKTLDLLLETSVLCNNASLNKEEKNGWQILGDPTEAALLVAAAKRNLTKSKLNMQYLRVDEIPFDSKRKLMTAINKVAAKRIAYVKGAPDVILNLCDKIYINGRAIRLNDEEKDKILKVNEKLTEQALRVLGFAFKVLDKETKEKEIESNLTFIGLEAMEDPPREDVKADIQKCNEAGIRIIMITGDHKNTAIAIAKELGLKGKAISSVELEKIPLSEFKKVVEKYSIYARIDPKHKLSIINTLIEEGYVVAMMGDGVNDAPALKKADIGIAIGSGTDVAKEASDMILLDDNLNTVVNAIEEGRTIYDNIKKFVNYLLSTNLAEILIIFLATLFGLPLPLTAIQILWLNLVTDGLPALALGADPARSDIMKKMPRDPKEPILTKQMKFAVLTISFLI